LLQLSWPQIRQNSLKLDKNSCGRVCLIVVLNSSHISLISQWHRPIVTGVTWGWTISPIVLITGCTYFTFWQHPIYAASC
jgi:hypothetical protein